MSEIKNVCIFTDCQYKATPGCRIHNLGVFGATKCCKYKPKLPTHKKEQSNELDCNRKIVLELLPAIIAAIKAIEAALPEANKGAEKLALVREIITSTGEEATKNWPLIESAINKLVAFFNKLGVFKSSK